MEAPREKAILWRKGRICRVFVIVAAICCQKDSLWSMIIPRSLIVSVLAIVLLPYVIEVKVMCGFHFMRRCISSPFEGLYWTPRGRAWVIRSSMRSWSAMVPDFGVGDPWTMVSSSMSTELSSVFLFDLGIIGAE